MEVECYYNKEGGLLYHDKTVVVLAQVQGPGFAALKAGFLTGRLSGDGSLRYFCHGGTHSLARIFMIAERIGEILLGCRKPNFSTSTISTMLPSGSLM